MERQRTFNDELSDTALDIAELAAILDWLGGLLQAPVSIDAVARMREPAGEQLIDGIGVLLACPEGVSRMRHAFTHGIDAAAAARELARAYTFLFDGVAGPMTTSLYESAYTGTGRLFQQPCEDMRRMLSLSSRGVLSECHEPPDHVSIELALLADRLRYRDERLVARLCTSLRGWTPELARACGECDSSGFYAGVTRLLVAALNRLTASINGRRPQNSDLRRTHHVIPN